jgi:tRNA(Ile)-lysidine synthetase-like protein
MTERASDLAVLISRAMPSPGTAVLAVSGGLDSITLLDVAATVCERRKCALMVATFDHASGAHGTRAASFVARVALAYGIPVVVGRAVDPARGEAAWRAARWQFLREVARASNAVIVTAHTRDDQVETVLMRAMRDAGARGLAGLRSQSDVRRPFIEVRREELKSYAEARGLTWLDDPTNKQREYLRNRLRHDLLPSLRDARPTLATELIELGDRAAAWRRELASLVDWSVRCEVGRDSHGTAMVDVWAAELTEFSPEVLAIVWPELAARAGVTLDRRGTRRAVEFTRAGKVGSRIQLSGGWELVRSRDRFELRTRASRASDGARPLEAPMTWDRWAFASTEGAPISDHWRISLPADLALWVRAWNPGDRLVIRHGEGLIARKVKYFLSDAGISGHIRARWPVVVSGNEIVWIPGIRRSDAAAARSGRPVVTYACDYLDRRS